MRVCAGGRRQEAGGGGIPLGEMNLRPVLALNEEKQTKNILRLTDGGLIKSRAAREGMRAKTNLLSICSSLMTPSPELMLRVVRGKANKALIKVKPWNGM